MRRHRLLQMQTVSRLVGARVWRLSRLQSRPMRDSPARWYQTIAWASILLGVRLCDDSRWRLRPQSIFRDDIVRPLHRPPRTGATCSRPQRPAALAMQGGVMLLARASASSSSRAGIRVGLTLSASSSQGGRGCRSEPAIIVDGRWVAASIRCSLTNALCTGVAICISGKSTNAIVDGR